MIIQEFRLIKKKHIASNNSYLTREKAARRPFTFSLFTQRTVATLTLIDRDVCIPLLDALQKAALIRDYELRDSEKVFVTIQRLASENKKKHIG